MREKMVQRFSYLMEYMKQKASICFSYIASECVVYETESLYVKYYNTTLYNSKAYRPTKPIYIQLKFVVLAMCFALLRLILALIYINVCVCSLGWIRCDTYIRIYIYRCGSVCKFAHDSRNVKCKICKAHVGTRIVSLDIVHNINKNHSYRSFEAKRDYTIGDCMRMYMYYGL